MKRNIGILFFILLFGHYAFDFADTRKVVPKVVPIYEEIISLYHDVTLNIKSLKNQLNSFSENLDKNTKEIKASKERLQDLSVDPDKNEIEMRELNERLEFLLKNAAEIREKMESLSKEIDDYLEKHEKRKRDLIKKIKSGKYNLNDKNADNETALHCAAKFNYPSLAKVLLNYGANPNIKDNWGMNALHAATEIEAEEVVEVITDFVNDLLNSQDRRGKTPIHYACDVRGKLAVVQSLLSCKIELDIKDNDGKRPLDIANTSERPDIAKVLMAY